MGVDGFFALKLKYAALRKNLFENSIDINHLGKVLLGTCLVYSSMILNPGI